MPTRLDAGTGYDSYRWQDGSDDAALSIDAPGMYWVEVAADTCLLRDTLVLAEHPTQCRCPVFAPSAFTPNGDGINDAWQPQCACTFADYSLRIYNRWGLRVFHSDQPATAWTGHDTRSTPIPGGVYTFVLHYRFAHESFSHQQAGTVWGGGEGIATCLLMLLKN